MKIETIAVHAGEWADRHAGGLTDPIQLSTTFERGEDGGYPHGYIYSRNGNPNRTALEECLAALEGGRAAASFASGMAAATAIFQALSPGDHVVAPSDAYYGTGRLLRLAVRRDRVLAPVWVGVLVLMSTVSALASASLYASEAERVRLPEPTTIVDRYPHQLSGGQRQRVAIAMALACRPRLLIADEPTTALDVTIQAEVLELLRELQREYGMALIIVTHNFGVIADIADRVAVMHAGLVVEQGEVHEIFGAPKDPYTVDLIGASNEAETRAALDAAHAGTGR